MYLTGGGGKYSFLVDYLSVIHPYLLFFLAVLVYSCPEESAVRLKMTYSSSKASVVAAAAEVGTTVDHMVRVHASCACCSKPLAQSHLTTLVQF